MCLELAVSRIVCPPTRSIIDENFRAAGGDFKTQCPDPARESQRSLLAELNDLRERLATVPSLDSASRPAPAVLVARPRRGGRGSKDAVRPVAEAVERAVPVLVSGDGDVASSSSSSSSSSLPSPSEPTTLANPPPGLRRSYSVARAGKQAIKAARDSAWATSVTIENVLSEAKSGAGALGSGVARFARSAAGTVKGAAVSATSTAALASPPASPL